MNECIKSIQNGHLVKRLSLTGYFFFHLVIQFLNDSVLDFTVPITANNLTVNVIHEKTTIPHLCILEEASVDFDHLWTFFQIKWNQIFLFQITCAQEANCNQISYRYQ